MKKLGRDILIILAVVLVVRSCFFEPYRIPSGSMIPTLLVGDLVLVNKFEYGYSRFSFPFAAVPFEGRFAGSVPQRGDVAVFRKPTSPSEPFIKRIVGLPGDRLQVYQGRLHINGEEVARVRGDDFVFSTPGGQVAVAQFTEQFRNGNQHSIIEIMGDNSELDNTRVYEVPEGHVFAMGDNRDNSRDSRYLGSNEVGYIPLDYLIGPAEVIILSYNFDAAVWNWLRWGRFFHPID